MADRAFLERLSRELTDQGKRVNGEPFALMTIAADRVPQVTEKMRV